MNEPTRRVSPAATLLVGTASVAGLLAYSDPVELGAWLLPALGLLTGLVVLLMAVRLLTRSRILPTALGLAVGITVAVPMHTEESFPTPDGVRALLDAIGDGAAFAATSVAPVSDAAPLGALVTTGLALLFLIAEHLTVSWRAAGFAGALLLLPWLPPIVMPWAVPWVPAAVALAAWLGTLALTSMHEEVTLPPRLGAWAGATAAAVGMAVLVAPLSPGVPGWGMLPQTNLASSSSTRLDLGLDLRDSLNTNSESIVLTYSTAGGPLDVLRLRTLEDFTGADWERPDDSGVAEDTSGWILWPEQSLLTQQPTQTVSISVDTLTEGALPLTVDPRTVSVSDAWSYYAGSDEVRSDSTDTSGLEYTLVTDPSYVTADRLRTLSGPDVAGETLAIADAIDADRIGDLAAQIVADAGATTRYDEAVAIQNWLRDPAEFTYDTTVALTGDDAVSEFLDTREGYCVQFATTMVVMARTLDIPARVGVGFLGGEQIESGTYEVIAGNAHAWPELYFPGTGWVRFEPTPAVQATAPSYASGDADDASPTPSPSASPSETAAAAATPSASSTTSASPTAQADQEGSETSGGSGWAAWAFLAIALIAAGAIGWFVLRRRQVSAAAAHGAEAAWARLRQRLPDDARWPASATPFEAAAHIRDTVSLSEEADAALTALTEAVVSSRYAPDSGPSEGQGDSQDSVADESLSLERLRGLADTVADSARSHES
ncbi:DUF3488 and transglutaminase-like domain-containing protein [Demequina sp. NBRC 110054]|uniref:transglutaminase family protein n=1 Tax=Demequina sp. NBRC 110054 TaxID=1570343 RepID=UPI0013565F92|nr:DUF3488 and transglutaminase-like domain-containing protein [Demequina sp. NBRC 110054]